MKKGDLINTPRFLKVRIEKVFRNVSNAKKQGFVEPTYYEDVSFGILGKSIGDNRMKFCGYKK